MQTTSTQKCTFKVTGAFRSHIPTFLTVCKAFRVVVDEQGLRKLDQFAKGLGNGQDFEITLIGDGSVLDAIGTFLQTRKFHLEPTRLPLG